ncbi:MAG: hypothetical protein HZB16_14880 [Armatimonadetes bacterium]|nr:hypothetical protein [Armatimonadota bacterium]
MPDFKLVRLVRTPSSEVYLIWDEQTRLGQVDLHYADGLVHGTVILEKQVEREQIEALIGQLDEDIVSSYLPDFEREDFFVNVFTGEEILSYSDNDDDETEDEH